MHGIHPRRKPHVWQDFSGKQNSPFVQSGISTCQNLSGINSASPKARENSPGCGHLENPAGRTTLQHSVTIAPFRTCSRGQDINGKQWVYRVLFQSLQIAISLSSMKVEFQHVKKNDAGIRHGRPAAASTCKGGCRAGSTETPWSASRAFWAKGRKCSSPSF